jgi:hypothetical protein
MHDSDYMLRPKVHDGHTETKRLPGFWTETESGSGQEMMINSTLSRVRLNNGVFNCLDIDIDTPIPLGL